LTGQAQLISVLSVRNVLFFMAISLVASGCAYHFGFSERALPGGYTRVAIPTFKNKSNEVGIEPMFTNALIDRFERSQVARVTDSGDAPVTLEGMINKVDVVQQGVRDNSTLFTLPSDTVLATDYRVVVSSTLMLRRKSDERVIWQGNFSNEKVYHAPQIGTAIVNSANATYNQSALMQAINLLAQDMMLEAHDRITENF
jgi:hypothetical protein